MTKKLHLRIFWSLLQLFFSNASEAFTSDKSEPSVLKPELELLLLLRAPICEYVFFSNFTENFHGSIYLKVEISLFGSFYIIKVLFENIWTLKTSAEVWAINILYTWIIVSAECASLEKFKTKKIITWSYIIYVAI